MHHGGGGYTVSDVYAMPVWLRRFHIQCLNDVFKQRNELSEKRNKELQRNARKR